MAHGYFNRREKYDYKLGQTNTIQEIINDEKRKQRFIRIAEHLATLNDDYKQKKQAAKDKINSSIAENVKTLKKLANNLLAEMLEMAKTESVDKVVEKFESELVKVKEIEAVIVKDELKVQRNIICTHSMYDLLFARLCEKNSAFFFVAPFSMFTHSLVWSLFPEFKTGSALFTELDKTTILSIQAFYIEKDVMLQKTIPNYQSLFNNEYFIQHYLRFFPELITELDKTDKNYFFNVQTAISIDPSKFNKVAKNLKEKELVDLCVRTPGVFPYLNAEQLETFATNRPNCFGRTILNYPEVLEKLDQNFFVPAVRGFKFIFSTVSAQNLLQIEDYMQRFTGWTVFFERKKSISFKKKNNQVNEVENSNSDEVSTLN